MAGKTNKGRKIGRAKAGCLAYQAGHRRELNKLRGILRHLKRRRKSIALAPADVKAAMSRCSAVIGAEATRRLTGGSQVS